MKLVRCEKHHLYPADLYYECPFCSGELDEDSEEIKLPEIEYLSQEMPQEDDEDIEYGIEEIRSEETAEIDKMIYSGRKTAERPYYSIDTADPDGEKYTDKIIGKAEKEAMIKKANAEYNREHELHINSKMENAELWLRENTEGLRDAVDEIIDMIGNAPESTDVIMGSSFWHDYFNNK